MNLPKTLVACTTVLCLTTTVAIAAPLSDFDDGTDQGWTVLDEQFGRVVAETTGGNPDGFLRTLDTMPYGDPVRVVGPPSFSGNLNIYNAIAWDDYIYDHGSETTRPVRPCIFGTDGTIWTYNAQPLDLIGQWQSNVVEFSATGWSGPLSGSLSYQEVLANGTIGFMTDTSELSSVNEAGLDNITLLPEPSTILILLLTGLVARPRRA